MHRSAQNLVRQALGARLRGFVRRDEIALIVLATLIGAAAAGRYAGLVAVTDAHLAQDAEKPVATLLRRYTEELEKQRRDLSGEKWLRET